MAPPDEEELLLKLLRDVVKRGELRVRARAWLLFCAWALARCHRARAAAPAAA
jgi:hypothetical protein